MDPNLEARAVLDFWLKAGPQKWWSKSDAFDAEIRERFGALRVRATHGDLDDWESHPDEALALIILLDQFSRNLFRNDAQAFAQDEKCVGLVERVMAAGLDRKMPPELMSFCYLPLMHSEKLDHQNMCVSQMERMEEAEQVKFAILHRDIIEDFGRFPHRNTVLGRVSTEEEIAFLEGGGFSG